MGTENRLNHDERKIITPKFQSRRGADCLTSYFAAVISRRTFVWRKRYQYMMNSLLLCRILATAYLYTSFLVLSLMILMTSCLSYVVRLFQTVWRGEYTALTNMEELIRIHLKAKSAMRSAAVITLDVAISMLIFGCSWIWHVNIIGPVPMSRSVIINNEISIRSLSNEDISRRDSRWYRWNIPTQCLVMSNHLSNLDGFATKAALYPSRCAAVMKSTISSIPIVGSVLRLIHQPLVYFTEENGGWGVKNKEKTFEACEKVLEYNLPILVYPEGIRNMSGCPQELAQFRYGMIKFAVMRELPIVVSIIYGSHKGWPVNNLFIRFTDVDIAISDSVIFPKKTDSVQEVSNAIRTIMIDLLNQRILVSN